MLEKHRQNNGRPVAWGFSRGGGGVFVDHGGPWMESLGALQLQLECVKQLSNE